jgi:integrase
MPDTSGRIVRRTPCGGSASSIRAIRSQFHVDRPRAQRLQDCLAAVVQGYQEDRAGQDVHLGAGPDSSLSRQDRRPALPRRRRDARRKHAATAEAACPPFKEKNVAPYTIRHTAAMSLLKAGTDTSVIALWLGHGDPRPPRSTSTRT